MSRRLRRKWVRCLREAFRAAWAIGGARTGSLELARRAIVARTIFLAAYSTQTRIAR